MSLESVVYCGVCSFPPEYCEFSGKLRRCKIWLCENNEELFNKLYSDTSTHDLVNKLQNSSIGEAREEKLEKDLKKLEARQDAKEQRELAKKLSSKVTIKREARTKKKSMVVISGLEIFEIDMKKLAKTFASKFATGCSVSKNVEKKEEIILQGDLINEVDMYINSLLQEKGLTNVKVERIDSVKKIKQDSTPSK